MYFNGPGAGPPPNPERVETFILGCALFAHEFEVQLAGGKTRHRAVTRATGRS